MTTKISGYLGTYTKVTSEGVYQFTLDLDQEQIVDVTPVAKVDNPTYLTLSAENQFLYAVSKEADQGGVTAFSIDQVTGGLNKLNSLTLPGSPPCHVSVNKENTIVVTANYHTKQIVSYLINPDGSLKEIADIVEHKGSGPHERQEKAHMHYAGFSPDEKYVFAVDLGSDEITTYAIDQVGKLTKEHVFEAPAGSGPRHLTFAPNGEYAYAMTELSSEVLTLKYNADTGEFTQLQRISAIPESFNDVNDGSAIHVTDDGKFIYAGNRGHGSIATFRIDPVTNLLEFLDWTGTEGDWPRDFALTPDNKLLIASNQNSGTLTVFNRDQNSGKLTLKQADIKVPEVVCVKFINNQVGK
ncbi:lactonase family protein [Amphibacillus sp. MSJ-3]|uniref:lactonase family protein n=1 Tax=Amphibacillus sp. MSJ-3 TaxID=2841505 RepID=UPI001C0EADE3|nr:lactonase family protein [Amphibacillus sp. MSJ-3]MBU5595260.1 lactonase family protein [Amphibacillus sp. MSJ-3]